MKFWKLSGGASQAPQGQGFQEALKVLTERRLSEMRGVWQRMPERMRRAEAGRRARKEMARRIAQHTDSEALSEATIARRGRRDQPPTGVDKLWLDRWAAIDRAGGMTKMARQLGTTPARVRSWRDSADPSAKLPSRRRDEKVPPGAPTQRIGVETDGFVIVNGKEYPKRIPESGGEDYASLDVDPQGEVIEAWVNDDTERLYELLADEIVMQWITPRWDLPATYELGYRIEELLKFLIDP
ncbi:hypothetical protein ACWDUN_22515 [Mycobacterium sp. NPDC003323]